MTSLCGAVATRSTIEQVPQDEVELEEAVVRCLMVLLNKETGLSALSGSANLWPVIAVRRLRCS